MTKLSLSPRHAVRPKPFSRGATLVVSASAPTTTSTGLPLVVLKGGKKKMLVGDTPAVTLFPGTIDCVIGRPPPGAGDLVLVVDGTRESVLAYGVYNPDSTFAVRVLGFFGKNAVDLDAPPPIDLDALVQERLVAAASLRTEALALREVTSAFRLCNAEGDMLPGLIVDVFGGVAVVQSSAAWIEARRGVVTACLEGLGYAVVWRAAVDMLALEGIEVSEDGEEPQGAPQVVVIEEHGVKFNVDTSSQKTGGYCTSTLDWTRPTCVRLIARPDSLTRATRFARSPGFYCDQRDNRRVIREIANRKSVADLCCYSGGFAIYAALGGATRVVGVDSSQQAVDLATSNAALNGVDGVCRFVKADASDWMDEAIKAGEEYDLVVLDPPKLAPTRKSLTNATRKYVSLNTKAMRLVKDGGLLMTCSCSGAMTQGGTFRSAVIAAAARRAGVQASLVSKAGAGADHVIDLRYGEGEYLSNYIVRVTKL